MKAKVKTAVTIWGHSGIPDGGWKYTLFVKSDIDDPDTLNSALSMMGLSWAEVFQIPEQYESAGRVELETPIPFKSPRGYDHTLENFDYRFEYVLDIKGCQFKLTPFQSSRDR